MFTFFEQRRPKYYPLLLTNFEEKGIIRKSVHFLSVKNIPAVYLILGESCDIMQIKTEQKRSQNDHCKKSTKGVTRNETVYYGSSV